MDNNEFTQIEAEGMAVLADSPYHFSPEGYNIVIPLLSIIAIDVTTREKDHPFSILIPGKSRTIIEVRLAGQNKGDGYEISIADSRKLIEKIRRLQKSI